MMNFIDKENDKLGQLRDEIAILAAKLIAEEGAEYGAAKRRATKQLIGNQKLNGNLLPTNEQIEQEVRDYNALFFADTQPIRLHHLRVVALELMLRLEQFNPYLVGAVLNGTAGEHSDIYLHLYTDNSKDIMIYLLNLGLDCEVSENQNSRFASIETLSFFHRNEGIHLLIHDFDDLRHTDHKERASIAALKAILDQPNNP